MCKYYKRRNKILEEKRLDRAENPDKYNNYAKNWREKNPDKVAEATSRRRAVKASVPYDDHTREEIYKRDGGICYLCREYIAYKFFELDHKIPLSRLELNPTHTRDNVAVTCRSCNRAKRDKTPEEFIEWIKSFSDNT